MTVKTEDIKLILCDIDNTILPPHHTAISRRVKEAFDKVRQKGIQVIIDTGRHYTFIPPSFFEDLPMEYIVTINGACLCDHDGNILYKKEMSEEQMNRITALCQENGLGLGFKFSDRIVTYANYDIFVEGYTQNIPELRNKILNDDAKRSHHLTAGYPLGTFLIGNENIIEPFVHTMPELTFAWSARRGYDVFLKDITKASGAEPLLEKLGIGWQNVLAFGDAGNDTPMIQAAGIGVAMENSKDDVREAADMIAPPCDEDGVAQVLEDLHLI